MNVFSLHQKFLPSENKGMDVSAVQAAHLHEDDVAVATGQAHGRVRSESLSAEISSTAHLLHGGSDEMQHHGGDNGCIRHRHSFDVDDHYHLDHHHLNDLHEAHHQHHHFHVNPGHGPEILDLGNDTALQHHHDEEDSYAMDTGSVLGMSAGGVVLGSSIDRRETAEIIDEPYNKDSKKRKREEKRATPSPISTTQHHVTLELFEVIEKATATRAEIVKGLWKYIKEHDLQDPKNRKEIICDEKLKSLFDRDRVCMFEMNRYIQRHILSKMIDIDEIDDNDDGDDDDNEVENANDQYAEQEEVQNDRNFAGQESPK